MNEFTSTFSEDKSKTIFNKCALFEQMIVKRDEVLTSPDVVIVETYTNFAQYNEIQSEISYA